MTDETRPPELPAVPLPEGSEERKPLRRRIADNWNGLGVADKARVIGAVAAMVGGLIAIANGRATDDEPDDAYGLPDVALIVGPSGAQRDGAAALDSPRWPSYSGPVRGYWRNQCLDPRSHANGNCTHAQRWVPDYTKGPHDGPLGGS